MIGLARTYFVKLLKRKMIFNRDQELMDVLLKHTFSYSNDNPIQNCGAENPKVAQNIKSMMESLCSGVPVVASLV